MAPPSATHTSETVDTGASVSTNGRDGAGNATLEPGLTKKQAAVQEGAIKFLARSSARINMRRENIKKDDWL
jgi:hypothetical protein